ncbi:MAG: hypothetical protein QOE14_2859 [Humisphaera sp.]|nr:hypothetical protein [Humisphaera sp.]
MNLHRQVFKNEVFIVDAVGHGWITEGHSLAGPMPTFQPLGSNRSPKSNAERQQAWRDRHRPCKRKMLMFTPAAAVAQPAMSQPQAPPPHSAAQIVAGAAGAGIVRMSDPAAGKVIEMYGTCVRRLTPAQRLQLARLIFDGVAAADVAAA